MDHGHVLRTCAWPKRPMEHLGIGNSERTFRNARVGLRSLSVFCRDMNAQRKNASSMERRLQHCLACSMAGFLNFLSSFRYLCLPVLRCFFARKSKAFLSPRYGNKFPACVGSVGFNTFAFGDDVRLPTSGQSNFLWFSFHLLYAFLYNNATSSW